MSGARERALRALDVSRETAERLDGYVELLAAWTAKINLVAASTLADPWTRHVLDCGQMFAIIGDRSAHVVDLGSGAGLPGLVLACMGQKRITLIESDRRKAIFLRECARTLDLSVEICNQRIENVPPQSADWATARALAPLRKLQPLARRHLRPGGRCCFAKGRSVDAELAELPAAERDAWRRVASASNAESVILVSGEHTP